MIKKDLRINNIDFRKYKHQKKYVYEIVKWQKNIHFGKEQEYKKDGYIDSFGGDFIQKGAHYIQKSFFDHKESCFTIAFLVLNKKEPCIELKSVGDRLLGLSSDERNDFWEVYSYANKKLERNIHERID